MIIYLVNESYYLQSPEERISLLKSLADDYSFIARKYLKRENGILFTEKYPSHHEAWKPYPGLRTEKADAITRFIQTRRPDLVQSLHDRLSEAEERTDKYIA